MNILLTGGRAPATLELARLLVRNGDRVFVGDSVKWQLCRFCRGVKAVSYSAPSARFRASEPSQTPFIHDVIDIVRQHAINLIIPTCEELFYLAEAKHAIEQHCKLYCSGIDLLEPLHNKLLFTHQIEPYGLPAPVTQQIESEDEVMTWYTENHNTPFVLKPVYSRFGASVHFFHQGIDHLESRKRLTAIFHNESYSKQSPWIIQKHVDGKTLCSFGIARDGQLLTHAVYPVSIKAGQSAVLFEAIRHNIIESWVRVFVQETDYTGLIAFDFIVDGQGQVWPIECNPRLTSGIHLLAGDHNLRDTIVGTVGINTTETLPRLSATSYADGSLRSVKLVLILFGLKQLFSWVQFKRWLKALLFSRDVIFRWTDPLPAFGQFVCLFNFWRISRRCRIGLTEATTHDIAYPPVKEDSHD